MKVASSFIPATSWPPKIATEFTPQAEKMTVVMGPRETRAGVGADRRRVAQARIDVSATLVRNVFLPAPACHRRRSVTG
jgi:hypothetical protein